MKKYERESDKITLPPDTVQVGCGITMFGKRYIVSEMDYTTSPDGSLDVGLLLQPYGNLDPVLYYYAPPVIKAKRKRTKVKRKRTKAKKK
jgi:hypothetical protein